MDEFKKRLIHLIHASPLSWKTVYTLLKADPCLSSLYSPSFAQSSNDNVKISLAKLQKISIDALLDYYHSNDIHLISLFDEDYPMHLKAIHQPPWILFAKGDISLLGQPFPLAVVGSREATPYGKQAIEILFPELIKYKAVIISGLAKGIDAHAHKMAIKLGGRTIGVIAGGIHHLYPKENLELAKFMMKDHLVLSEYPPDTKPEKWQFPLRNRIIGGLAKGTLVIEAKKRSGSFITADFALNEGREVFAVPGSILTPSSVGTNELIQLGAKLVKEPKDIIEEIFSGL
ncbi:DNA processing protein [Mesobacillus persicus]|uniref:DNA processing protein n=1 Tax=Mesobacillus persicus TaxID=930146 RepID=A0A1H7YQL5_9BACI|nr:DNA-processing protein DprA [Mesobacillus persicus]SEM47598.1 DNA processing protein [Mesobacillus persicus]